MCICIYIYIHIYIYICIEREGERDVSVKDFRELLSRFLPQVIIMIISLYHYITIILLL